MKIYKYPLPIGDTITVVMPQAARILAVQEQHGDAQLWAMVDPDAPKVRRKLAIRGTGHDASGLGFAEHLATFQMRGGQLVFHVFDLGEEAIS